MGHKKLMRLNETCISKTTSMERFFDEKVSLENIVVSGSTEDSPLKKTYTLDKLFFSLTFVSLKKNWFV